MLGGDHSLTLLALLLLQAFALCCFITPDFWSVAFDSGGVTTGPMTVPFIMAIGAGVSGMRSDGEDDSFGLVALCSIGPILAVLILGICFDLHGGEYDAFDGAAYDETDPEDDTPPWDEDGEE